MAAKRGAPAQRENLRGEEGHDCQERGTFLAKEKKRM